VKCSCGCQRKLSFRDVRADRRARTARALVEEMEALAFADDEDEYRRAFLFEGVSWRNQYTRVAHRELTPDQVRADGAWAAWRAGARVAVREARQEQPR
jgi:hypothetical protein